MKTIEIPFAWRSLITYFLLFAVSLGDYKPIDDVDYGYQSSRHKRDKRLSFTKSTMPPPPRAMTDNEPDWMEDEMDNPSSEKSSEVVMNFVE